MYLKNNTYLDVPCLSAIIFCLTILLFSYSCKMEKIAVSWEKMTTPAQDNQPLRSIWFKNTDTAYAVGGDQYLKKYMLMTSDGGQTWYQWPFSGHEKGLYGLIGTSQKMYLGNYDGQIYSSADQWQTWDMQQTGRPDIGWVPVRRICFSDDAHGVSVGGYGSGYGLINTTSDGGLSWQSKIPAVELRSVCCASAAIYFACGYGVVIRSTDNGDTWETLPADGDFFMDICFPNAQVGFVVGYQGKIMKTINGGQSWQTLRKGSDWVSARPHFNGVWFKNENTGWIVGNKLVWQTNDGGQSWQAVEGLDFSDFYGLTYIDGQVFIVGENNTVVRLSVE